MARKSRRASPSPVEAAGRTEVVFRGRWAPWILLAPSLVILAAFLYYPVLSTFALAAYRVAFLGLQRQFVGLGNLVELARDPQYLASLRITLRFAAVVVAGGLASGLALALLANQPVRGARFYRMLLIWPYALSPAVAGTIWLFLFNPAAGAVNYVLDQLFGWRPGWLTDPTVAPLMLMAAAIWKNLGYNVVFYLAALQNLPGQVLDAASVDGAGAWSRFWHVTLPLLSPMTLFLVVTNLGYAFFEVFGLVDVMTRGGPVGATTVLIYKLYRDGFEYYRTGFAATQSVLLFVMVIGLTFLNLRYGRGRVSYDR